MKNRGMVVSCAVALALAAGAAAQEKPPSSTSPPASTAPATFASEAKGLTADDYAARQAALSRLQGLVAEQLKERAAIQDVLDTLRADISKQQMALAMISDEEAKTQIAGLLEMERGLAGWTAQTMSEPLERRKKLLEWGLTKQQAPLLAKAYAHSGRTRIAAIKALATDDSAGATWTLSRLMSDPDLAIRTAAMSACWNRKPTDQLINTLWYRGIAGPMADPARKQLTAAEDEARKTLVVDFPGMGPMLFGVDDDQDDFNDADTACSLLVHYNSPAVGERVKALVADCLKENKPLWTGDDDPIDVALLLDRLVETYKVKEAVPLLAEEALSPQRHIEPGEMNGRPFAWTNRTMAIGTLAKLIGKDAADFELIRAHPTNDRFGWMWAFDYDVKRQGIGQGNPDEDGPAVRAFYAWWKDHYSEYGVKEKPADLNVPEPRAAAQGGRRKPIPKPAGIAPNAPADVEPDMPQNAPEKAPPPAGGPEAE